MDHHAKGEAQQQLSRRSFLGTLGATAAGLLLLPGIDLLRGGPRGAASAKVAITQVDCYDRVLIRQKVEHLFEALEGITDVVRAGDRVAIKINLTGGSGSAFSPKLHGVPITESVWTHPEVVRAVGELILDCGVRPSDLYLVEALWDTASFNNFGYREVQRYLGAEMIDLNSPNPYSAFVALPVGERAFFYSSFRVNAILAEVNVYLSIPKLKHHYEAGVTAALKNQVGMVPKQLYEIPGDRGRRGALHSEGGTSPTHLPRAICDLNLARPVQLAVVDGVRNAHGGEGVWNPTFQLAEDHVLLAGKDPVATDNIAARLLGIDPEVETLPLPAGGRCDNHLELLSQKGAGVNRLQQIEIVGDGAGLVTTARPFLVTDVPANFQLCQNFPNPFNPSTTITFALPRTEEVAIKIFNSSGQEVATLAEGVWPPGSHQLHWNASHLAGGVYLCRMRAGRFHATRKLVYQK